MRPPHTGRLLCCKETLLYFRSMNLENKPRVIVADAQFLVTDSLRFLLEQEGFELGGVARYVYELEELLRKEVPNLLLTDYARSEEHTSELQSRPHLVCRLLLEKKKKKKNMYRIDHKRNNDYIR